VLRAHDFAAVLQGSTTERRALVGQRCRNAKCSPSTLPTAMGNPSTSTTVVAPGCNQSSGRASWYGMGRSSGVSRSGSGAREAGDGAGEERKHQVRRLPALLGPLRPNGVIEHTSAVSGIHLGRASVVGHGE
jgi:hypothetical protein